MHSNFYSAPAKNVNFKNNEKTYVIKINNSTLQNVLDTFGFEFVKVGLESLDDAKRLYYLHDKERVKSILQFGCMANCKSQFSVYALKEKGGEKLVACIYLTDVMTSISSIHSLVVDENLRGHNLGSLLIAAAIIENDLAQKKITLESTDEGLPAYLKLGFRPDVPKYKYGIHKIREFNNKLKAPQTDLNSLINELKDVTSLTFKPLILDFKIQYIQKIYAARLAEMINKASQQAAEIKKIKESNSNNANPSIGDKAEVSQIISQGINHPFGVDAQEAKPQPNSNNANPSIGDKAEVSQIISQGINHPFGVDEREAKPQPNSNNANPFIGDKTEVFQFMSRGIKRPGVDAREAAREAKLRKYSNKAQLTLFKDNPLPQNSNNVSENNKEQPVINTKP